LYIKRYVGWDIFPSKFFLRIKKRQVREGFGRGKMLGSAVKEADIITWRNQENLNRGSSIELCIKPCLWLWGLKKKEVEGIQ